MRRIFTNQAGDTIVEVLLAITVVATVLAGAYVSSNRNLNNNQASQERGEALKLVESQVEQIKAGYSNLKLSAETSFCFDTNGAVKRLSFTPTDDAQTDPNNGSYPAECSQGTGGRYKLSIVQAANLYTVRARWDRIGGGQEQEIKIVYRIES